jgi:hypothetical protein
MSFSGPKVPPPPPPPPTPEDPNVQKKRDDAALAARKIRGRSANVLTSGSGASGQANVARRTLLGV